GELQQCSPMLNRSRSLWQGEHIHRMSHHRAVTLEGEHAAGPDLRAAAIIAGGNSNELLAIDREGGREPGSGRAQTGLPQGLAGLDVESPERAVPIADETDTAR